jgi:hypothetical protein
VRMVTAASIRKCFLRNRQNQPAANVFGIRTISVPCQSVRTYVRTQMILDGIPTCAMTPANVLSGVGGVSPGIWLIPAYGAGA